MFVAVTNVLVPFDVCFLLEVNEVLQVVSSTHVVLLSVRDHFGDNTLEKLVHPWSANPSETRKKKVTYLKTLTISYSLQVQMIFFTFFKNSSVCGY
jgi:hypothetical protein